MRRIPITQCEFKSSSLGNSRAVWVQQPTADPVGICIFLDGEYYLAHVRAAGIVDRLQTDGAIPSLVCAYVSCIDFETRWPESFCSPDFARFLSTELLPWVAAEFGVTRRAETVLAGLSLTGLSAAHAALHAPHTFTRVLCQSGSFWWNRGHLVDDVANRASSDTAFRITVGADETKEHVDHGKGLIQEESQLESNRRMRDALTTRGYRVSFDAFEGGHTVAAWRDDLPRSLVALFGM